MRRTLSSAVPLATPRAAFPFDLRQMHGYGLSIDGAPGGDERDFGAIDPNRGSSPELSEKA